MHKFILCVLEQTLKELVMYLQSFIPKKNKEAQIEPLINEETILLAELGKIYIKRLDIERVKSEICRQETEITNQEINIFNELNKPEEN